MRAILGLVDHWQTLISGVLAIVAAGGGSILLYRQITQAESHERARLRRRMAAVRATLPLTLRGLGEYARSATVKLIDLRSTIKAGHVGALPSRFDVPEIPSALAVSFAEIFEATDDISVVSLVSEIISEVQIISSRMDSLNDASAMAHLVGVPENLDQYIIQSARLYSLIEALFNFARRESDSGPDSVEWDRVTSMLGMMNIKGAAFNSLSEALAKRRARLAYAWEKPNRE